MFVKSVLVAVLIYGGMIKYGDWSGRKYLPLFGKHKPWKLADVGSAADQPSWSKGHPLMERKTKIKHSRSTMRRY